MRLHGGYGLMKTTPLNTTTRTRNCSI
ncbi:MAG TPA: hypothetical protein VEK32_16255 [Thermodesulfobacteriota bacterium]|nr:hypothetical protein [Thermodesulfobacteriota bacterium]